MPQLVIEVLVAWRPVPGTRTMRDVTESPLRFDRADDRTETGLLIDLAL